MILTQFDFRSTQGWLGVFWSIWLEMALWVLRCLNGLCHGNLDVFAAPWWIDNIFGIFGVRYANRGRTKYGVYSYPFFIWYLKCNERCWIKNVIAHFVAPKLCAETALFMGWDRFYLTRLSCYSWSGKFSDLVFDIGQETLVFFFFLVKGQPVNVDRRPL